jgi:hypothetical protein
MQPVATQQQQDSEHFWEFEDIDDLKRALGEYQALLDGMLLRKYGKEEVGGAAERPTPQQVEEFEAAVMRQRSTIDIAMEHIEDRYKTWWRVIDLYYRQGLSTEAQGWLVLMSRLGMRHKSCPPLVRCTLPRGDEFVDKRLEISKCKEAASLDCACDFYIFRRMLDYATETLWRAIQRRHEWKP